MVDDVELYRRLVAAQRVGRGAGVPAPARRRVHDVADLAAWMSEAGGVEVRIDGAVLTVVGTADDPAAFGHLLVRAGAAVEAGRAAADAAGWAPRVDHSRALVSLVLTELEPTLPEPTR